MSVDVANESGGSVDVVRLGALGRFVLQRMRIHPLADLSVVVVDEAAMADLNGRFKGESGATDVLAFPMDELRPGQDDEELEEGTLGDVVLCAEVAASQARDAGHAVEDELDLLCTHGILHLLGFDHHEPDDERAMFGLQARLLAEWQSAVPGAGGPA